MSTSTPIKIEDLVRSCVNCGHVGESFDSAYDGRWLMKCNLKGGSNRPHEVCPQHEFYKKEDEQID